VTNTTPPVLEVEGLKTWFETPAGTVHAVDGVSLRLERGRTLGIVGESGSGKSVLCRSLMGLLPSRQVLCSGRIRFNGEDITNWAASRMRRLWGRQMAMVFQDPMTSLNPVMKIGDQLTEGLRVHLGLSAGDAYDRAGELLKEVGIPEPRRRLRQYPHELSGGMRQRVTIAMALACDPIVLFADEPTTALDVTVQAQILDLLDREQAERNMTLVLVTHDLGVVAGRADEIMVMYAGKVVEQAPTDDLFANMKMPYTEALFESIPKIEQPSHTRLRTIAGRPPNLVNPLPGCRFAPRCPYVRDRCWVEEPPLRPAERPGHVFACWYPVGSPGSPTEREKPVVGVA